MSYVSAIGSLYLQNGGGNQTIAEVLNTGSDAGGQPLSGITLLSTSNISVVSGITTGDLATDTLVIQGNDYPVVGAPLAPAIGALGSIRINTFGAPVSTASNVFIQKDFENLEPGFYCAKVELDFITDTPNVITTAEIQISGGITGANIGFSLGLIEGGATVSTVVVPFFFYNRYPSTSPNAVVNVRYRCIITGGGNWQSTNESDIDFFRVF